MQEILSPSLLESLTSKTIDEWKARSDPKGPYAVCLELEDGQLRVIARYSAEGDAHRLWKLIHPDHKASIWERV